MIEVMKRNYKCKGLKTRKLNFDFEEADVEVEPDLLCEDKIATRRAAPSRQNNASHIK